MMPRRPPSSAAVPSRDPAEFERFYLAHVDAVMGFALSRTGSPQDAADLVTLVFIRAIEHADSFDPRRGSPRAWLMGICANAVVDHHRRSARETRLVERLKREVPLTTDDLTRLEARLDAQRLSGDLEDALGALPEGQQAVIDLVDRNEMPIRDAARVLGISRTAVRVRLSRARSTVRGSLSDPPTPEQGSER